MSTGAVFFAHKKRITERNSHLAGEASGSSISNGCQTKTERRRQLAGVGTGRGGTKLHASVAGSRVTAFLATAAPWEPYFTDNPRISQKVTGSRHDDVNFFSLPNPSGCTMALGFIQPLTEMNTRSIKIMFLGSRAQLVRRADSLTAICEPIVYTVWEP
jgi:hypothetical protein